MTALIGWANFYIIVGSAAGALIGLQFVVITLIANKPALRVAEGGAAFVTPTIVHFGMVLFLSAIISIPWKQIDVPLAISGLVGVGGNIYTGVVARRMRTQTIYKSVFEDWLFHVLLPCAVYLMLIGSSFVARSDSFKVLFVVAASMLVLLFIGIHNAWDAVTYHVFIKGREE